MLIGKTLGGDVTQQNLASVVVKEVLVLMVQVRAPRVKSDWQSHRHCGFQKKRVGPWRKELQKGEQLGLGKRMVRDKIRRQKICTAIRLYGNVGALVLQPAARALRVLAHYFTG